MFMCEMNTDCNVQFQQNASFPLIVRVSHLENKRIRII